MNSLSETFDVLILGGGWSGILALKHCLARRLTALVLEARDDLGGVWNFSEDPSLVTVMESTETTSSTCFTEASDLPMPKDEEFLHHERVLEYLRTYCDRFGLGPHLRFGAPVRRAHKVDGVWHVETPDGVFTARKLIVATGVHSRPDMSAADIFAGFRPGEQGALQHMGDIKRAPRDLRGKRVLVYGGGESASDLIEELIGDVGTARVVWSIPHGQHFFRKYGYWVAKNPITGRPVRPQAFDKQSSLLQGLISPAYRGKDGMRWGCKWTTSGSFLAYQGHGVPEWRSRASNMHAFINKSANVLDFLDRVRLAPQGAVAGCEGATVHFADGVSETFDRVILCTGYLSNLSYLPAEIGRPCISEHYKFVFHNGDPSVAFIGFVRPIFGSIPLISEIQSRWVARVFAGELSLPDEAARRDETRRDQAFWARFFRDTSRRIKTLVDVFIYTHTIARLTGDFPDRKRLLREDPFAWYLSIVGPYGSAMLSLNDPATREHAKSMLDHHRLIRRDTLPYMAFQVAAKLTRFDGVLSRLEEVKVLLQRSERARALAETPLGRRVLDVLSLPKKRFFVSSVDYPWKRHRRRPGQGVSGPGSFDFMATEAGE